MVHARGRDDHVDGVVGERQVGEVGDGELHPVGDVFALSALGRHVEHVALQIDAEETEVGASYRYRRGELARAATRVEDQGTPRRGGGHVLGDPPVHAAERPAGDHASTDGHGGTELPGAESVLLVELLAAGEVTQQQLADRLGLDKSRISRLCSALERKQLLTRHRDEANRRNLLLRITATGRKTAKQLRQTWHDRHERMLAAMTPDERHALLYGLGVLVRELTTLHSGRHTRKG